MAADESEEPSAPLPRTPRKREAEDWALVLVAEGLSPRVDRDEAGFGVSVEAGDERRAGEILAAYRAERAERDRRLAAPAPPATSTLEVAGGYALALSLLAFHLGLERSGRWDALAGIGRSQAALVLEGELWRLTTALTLHADLVHAVGNTLFGGLFLAALAGRLGLGFAVLAFVVTGTLGNLANALYYASAHSSIGASTGVFGLVGVLAGLAAWRRHRHATPGRGAWVAFGAALAILAMLGSGGPEVDFSAHLFGLAAGAATGLVLAVPLASRPRPGRRAQALAGATAAALLVVGWGLAFAAAPPSAPG